MLGTKEEGGGKEIDEHDNQLDHIWKRRIKIYIIWFKIYQKNIKK
jgi:hypothetical protein